VQAIPERMQDIVDNQDCPALEVRESTQNGKCMFNRLGRKSFNIIYGRMNMLPSFEIHG